MDFGLFPPEVNSGLMYTGPGSGPMLAAAAAWDQLSAELSSAAASCQSVISGLSGSWQGPSSTSMVTAATRQVAWLHTTAAQAEQTASQAKAAATAYQTAFSMTVPPPVIAANRSLLASLVATNFLGQNTPAIFTTEAHYLEMWAQDAAAMHGYAGASQAATSTLSPFTPAPPTSQPSALAGQAVAAGQAAGTSGASTMLSGLASPASSTSGLGSLPGLGSLGGLGGSSPMQAMYMASIPARFLMYPLQMLMRSMGQGANGSMLQMIDARIATRLAPLANALNQMSSAASHPVGAVTAGMGRAASLGALSVPHGWTGPGLAIKPVVTTLSTTSLSAAPVTSIAAPTTLCSEVALASMAGRALGGVAAKPRSTVVPRSPAGG